MDSILDQIFMVHRLGLWPNMEAKYQILNVKQPKKKKSETNGKKQSITLMNRKKKLNGVVFPCFRIELRKVMK
jgi:hypothetical protein